MSKLTEMELSDAVLWSLAAHFADDLEPTDRMVDAARKALIEAWRISGDSLPEGSDVLRAAIRAAMKAAGE